MNIILLGIICVFCLWTAVILLVPENCRRMAVWLLSRAEAEEAWRSTFTSSRTRWSKSLVEPIETLDVAPVETE